MRYFYFPTFSLSPILYKYLPEICGGETMSKCPGGCRGNYATGKLSAVGCHAITWRDGSIREDAKIMMMVAHLTRGYRV